jgi:hypothetical protein
LLLAELAFDVSVLISDEGFERFDEAFLVAKKIAFTEGYAFLVGEGFGTGCAFLTEAF